MKKYYKFLLVFVVAFAISCKANTEIDLLVPPPDDITEQNVDQTQLIERGLTQLQLSDAEKVALRFMLKDTKKPFTVSAATRADHMTAVRDSAGNPLMYVVNFEQGGFCIVSATKRSYPILAHGDEGFFDLEKVDQSGVCLWLDEMEYGITHQDTLSEEERIFLNSTWAEYEKGFDMAETRAYGDMNDPRYRAFSDRMGYHMSNGDAIPLANALASGVIPSYVVSGFQNLASNMGCPPEYAIIVRVDDFLNSQVGPLLTTNWHQGPPFNNLAPKFNGSPAPAGCVAIAVGQIMNYYKHPAKSYDWAGINANNSTDLANFISDIGRRVGMIYGKDGSSSNIDAANAALQNCQYSTQITTADPYFELLNYKRPYYADGRVSDGINGHAWVCDGIIAKQQRSVYKLDCQISRNGQYIYEMNPHTYDYGSSGQMYVETHINWGWGGYDDVNKRNPNAWYLGNPSRIKYQYNEYDFLHFRKYLTIRPLI